MTDRDERRAVRLLVAGLAVMCASWWLTLAAIPLHCPWLVLSWFLGLPIGAYLMMRSLGPRDPA